MAIPNFDGMSKDELMEFWARYHRPKHKDAEELVGDRSPGFTLVAAKAANYACNKAVARTCREKGDIQAAELYESVCERLYKEIPKELRW